MIGIMDWGIGGLSVYKAMPYTGEDVLYFSDSGFTPYGKTQTHELRNRLNEIAQIFSSEKIKDVYVACNAASSVLENDVETFSGVRFHSIIPAGELAVRHSTARSVGVIGGELTIASGLYQKRLQESEKSFSFTPAQPLSAFVERGELGGHAVEAAVADILSRLGPVDAVLLACTHYPALASVFKRIVPYVELLDPAPFVWSNESRITTEGQLARISVRTTGSLTQLKTSAKRAFDLDL